MNFPVLGKNKKHSDIFSDSFEMQCDGYLILLFYFAFFKTHTSSKHIVEEKQKKILDSIRYAKRIQTSLLPTEKYISKHLDRDDC